MNFEAELWEHEGQGAWCFVTVPDETSEDIRLSGAEPAGFGSIRVEVTVGASTWQTSVFPDKTSGCFVLPVKKAVRTAEGIEVGDLMSVEIQPL
ncbi:DUF1905 domain-containing protein [Nocardioides sp.]|uniref:DUF1905 domain-containing protein n=1 Tax=Nocardioides sp. TaxID=35761 RepID=UPI00356ABDDC